MKNKLELNLCELTVLAENGNADAQFALGLRLEDDDKERVLALLDQGSEYEPDARIKAEEWYRKAADQGHPEAQVRLAAMYFQCKDEREAARWLRKAAELGNADAQFLLGCVYEHGDSIPHDYEEAAMWYRAAAEQGNAKAQVNLGAMYADGLGIPQDHEEAAKWYRKAAEQGDVNGQFRLAEMYADGRIPQDYSAAAKLYLACAEQDDIEAQCRLAVFYGNGLGVPGDYAEALKWMYVAAYDVCIDRHQAPWQDEAAQMIEIAVTKMTPEQIQEARCRAREWLLGHGLEYRLRAWPDEDQMTGATTTRMTATEQAEEGICRALERLQAHGIECRTV